MKEAGMTESYVYGVQLYDGKMVTNDFSYAYGMGEGHAKDIVREKSAELKRLGVPEVYYPQLRRCLIQTITHDWEPVPDE